MKSRSPATENPISTPSPQSTQKVAGLRRDNHSSTSLLCAFCVLCVEPVVGGLLAALGLLAGCSASEVPAPAPDIVVVGGPGSADGRFATPRATAWDPRGCFYVVDKMGRIQRFDGAGRFLNGWSVPAIAKGRPTGLAVDPNGNLVVADTHYHRILRYTPEGKLLSDFGSEGTGPGRFIYPVGRARWPRRAVPVSAPRPAPRRAT